MIASFFIFLAYLVFIVATICLFTADYLVNVLQVTSYSQILYNLNFGVEGSSDQVWLKAIQAYFDHYLAAIVIMGFICLCLILYALISRKKKFFWRKGKKRRSFFSFGAVTKLTLILCVASGFTLADSAYIALDKVGYFTYRENLKKNTAFFEDHYVLTNQDLVTLNQDPKNLIVIWVESLETAMASKQSGGNMETSAIPELEALALENTNFAEEGKIGGAFQTIFTNFTIAGLMAETSGTPLVYHGEMIIDHWAEDEKFMPGVVTLGDILESNGYKNYLRIGSDGTYAGRVNYFTQHGNYAVLDFQRAVEDGDIPEWYHEWWGYEDAKLFEYAQRDLEWLYEQGETFNYNMLTADTHFPDGYECYECTDTFENQIENVYLCSNHRIARLVEWIQQQPFYEDTVVVIAGDHLSMDETINDNNQDYSRKVYFTMLNAPEAENVQRTFTTLDIFPTILSAMGFEIEGNRLGFGTNLYSGEATLVEQIGLNSINEQLDGSSGFYRTVILGMDPEDADQQ